MSSGSRRPNKSSGRSREPSSEGVPALQSFMSDTTVTTRDKHRNKFLRLLQNITGVEVDVSLSDGRVYRGVFYTATPFEGKKQEIALKGARKMDKSGRVVHDGNIDIGSTVLLLFSDIQTLTVTKSKISANQANKELDTDASLSRRTNIADLDGRNLESVSAAWLAPETSAKIDRGSMKSHVQGSWNQFEVNKRLYNVQDTFDENLYTKRLDKSSLTKEQQAKADRIANQIERSSTTNIHLKEERGQLVDTEGMDEEDLYSGVIRETPQQQQQQQQGGGKGFGRGSSSPAGGGAWRKMDVSGMVSPSSKRQQGDSPSSGQSMASPALPPGLSQDDGDATATASTPPTTEKSDTVEAEDKSAADTADSSTSKTEEKKVERDAAATQATPPKSTFSFNVSANEFVPSFAMKPPAAPTTPSTPPTSEGGGGRGGQHHSGGRGGRGGRGRGGRGNNYGAGNNFSQQQQQQPSMGFGPQMGGMPNMGYEMNPQMMYPQAPYGIPMGGMPMAGMPIGYDQSFQGGFPLYSGAGAYYGPGPGPTGMPFDPNFQGMPGVPMGYGEPAPNYFVPSSAGGDMGGALPVAAGLGNIASSAPSGDEGGGGKSGTPAASQESEVGASDAGVS